MGTSLALRGHADANALDALERFVLARDTVLAPRSERLRDEDGRPLLALHLHPAAEPLRATDLGGGAIAIEGYTGTAGPGYHQYVCELLRDASPAIGARWDSIEDESDYYESRNRRALEDATTTWLGTTALEILGMRARGLVGVQLSLPEGSTFEHDGAVATPMGPRDHAWLTQAARQPSSGTDVFPWWAPGEGAATLRGLAESAMWIDVRWRAPLIDAERELLKRVVTWLEQGHAIEPGAAWPWREWSEIFEHLGEESLRATRTGLRASKAGLLGKPIGYRRRPVRATLSGGWSIRVPGELAERWDERGTWVAWDRTRSLWFTSLELPGSAGSEATLEGLPALEGEGELVGLEDGELLKVARSTASEEDGKLLTEVRAHAALGEHAAVGTFVLERDQDADWALESWASLAHVEGTTIPRATDAVN